MDDVASSKKSKLKINEEIEGRNKLKQLKRIAFYDTDVRFAQFMTFLYSYNIKLGDLFRAVVTATNSQDVEFWRWLNKHKQQTQNRAKKEAKQIEKELKEIETVQFDYNLEPLSDEELEELYSTLEMDSNMEFEW